MSSKLSEQTIQDILKAILDSYLGLDLLTSKVLKTLIVQEDKVSISLRFGYPLGNHLAHLRDEIQQSLQPLLGAAQLQLTIDWKVNQHLPQAGTKIAPGIKNIIAVASGKGGVGKSTTAVNLALAIAGEGARVGILDADIYGPSQPHLLGINQKPILGANNQLSPVLKYGLQTMSMGYLVAEEAPMVWRGPMVSKALQQLLYETTWDNLDYLIVDLPPGTGDIQLTLAQKIPVSGVVIVTTPQEIALLDAKKALIMFRKLGISILGIVENMSTYICNHCGHSESIFGLDGGKKIAVQLDVPLLGQLPLNAKIQAQADQGNPTVVCEPEGEISTLYREIAQRITAQLSLCPRDYSAAFSNVVIS